MQNNLTLTKEETMSTTLNKKSGKGNIHGVISELSAFFTVKPGHEEELRMAVQRFKSNAQPGDKSVFEKLGLRDMRHVIFDNGRRVMWCTAFETDWDPYIDDAIEIFGAASWVDWMQHTNEYSAEIATASNAQIKQFLQSAQEQAATFFNALPNHTLAQMKKALQVNEAFERVLDDPAAAEALQHPALKPLLEQAAD
jgi:hypothetical protein